MTTTNKTITHALYILAPM